MTRILTKSKSSSSTSKMVLHVPGWSANPYLPLLTNSISSNTNWVAKTAHFPGTFTPLRDLEKTHPGVRAFHIHWIAPFFIDPENHTSRLKLFYQSLGFMVDIGVMRFKGIKIVWTVHNMLSHDSLLPRWEKMVRRILVYLVSQLIFHSKGARAKFLGRSLKRFLLKSSIIPHGHYLNSYPLSNSHTEALQQQFRVEKTDKVILIFGSVRYYKGIESFIQIFKQIKDDRLKLVIAGRSFHEELGDLIKSEALSDPRICFQLEHIADHEVASYFAISHLVVIPFLQILSSGSIVLSKSMGKALCVPDIAKVVSVSDEPGTFYYSNSAELIEILESLDLDKLSKMGRANKTLARELDWKTIAEKTVSLY